MAAEQFSVVKCNKLAEESKNYELDSPEATLSGGYKSESFNKGRLSDFTFEISRLRKTICVISRHYLESEWCSREIQVASFRLFDEKKDVLILVFLENIPSHQLSPYYRMKKLIQKKTYLSWPKPGEDTRVFWQKLRVALETKGNSEMEPPTGWN
ncbi:toll-like receptor 13 [Sinocyclocheilus grahami]|uniref:toll-like receptor 13 n=1 Tax=Sinocyclocheilus grahami TaxID=75366 RepID=UPI0007AC61A7|nr:PREDICTED: toll-like receptor 13 [Sinocyclocheilus grahami]